MNKQALACVKLLLENGALVEDPYMPLDPSQAYLYVCCVFFYYYRVREEGERDK
jgi:hypothetical protein